jgi:hypothetical protein
MLAAGPSHFVVIIVIIVSIVAIIISDTETTHCSNSLLTHNKLTRHDGSTPITSALSEHAARTQHTTLLTSNG